MKQFKYVLLLTGLLFIANNQSVLAQGKPKVEEVKSKKALKMKYKEARKEAKLQVKDGKDGFKDEHGKISAYYNIVIITKHFLFCCL